TVNESPGMATGDRCSQTGCGSCPDPGYAVGAPGFAGLAEVWSILGPLAIRTNAGLCVEVEANQWLGMIDGACIYGSLALIDHGIEGNAVFIGHNADAPLTSIGAEIIAEQPPMLAG